MQVLPVNIKSDTDISILLDQVVPYVWYMAFATFPAGILGTFTWQFCRKSITIIFLCSNCSKNLDAEIGCWMYASERQVRRLRLSFLKAVLSQEIGAFDTDLTSGKIITGISSHMFVIQDAIGEKVARKSSFIANNKKLHINLPS